MGASPSRWKQRRERRKLTSRRANPDGTMSLKDHLYDLRHRLGLALLIIAGGALFGFFWWELHILGLPSLGDIVVAPYCGIPVEQRLTQGGQGCQLLQTQPFEVFMIRLKVGAGAGMALTAPLWLYQVWRFIAPGLYAKERKFALSFVACASVLFVAGATLAFYVVPQGLSVLVGFGDEKFITALTAGEYISFVMALLLIFGVSFELPLIVVMLNLVGVLTYDKLRRWRRGIVFALFIFAAVATPGTDPISMVALAVALTLLFELAIQIARIHDKRAARKRKAEGWDDLADDEASPFDYTPSGVDGSDPSEEPASVAPEEPHRVRYDDAT
ncbi:twin-arginine translocase subunit TatC [Saccharothrix variisporea]|uniref:Sec-independent protein translocase protein TatC n=1 Tax=Saccharothrix variisporea TaxID=543527 RepID=A0A495X2Q9_9PSEU|nr:twin-arginine translocase subunit TatC [Saccharothrix variisporea]RKT68260.1 sec-independent protein translocase protein TatC [Saccharothrix variisporea]